MSYSYICRKTTYCNNENCEHFSSHKRRVVSVSMRNMQLVYCTRVHYCPSTGLWVCCGRDLPHNDDLYLERLGYTKKRYSRNRT